MLRTLSRIVWNKIFIYQTPGRICAAIYCIPEKSCHDRPYVYVQLVVLIVYTLVLDSFKYQIAQRIVGIIGEFFGDLAGDHAVQFVVGVDMGAAVGLIDLAVGAVLGAGVLGLIRLIGVVRLVDVFAAVEAGGHVAAGVDDGAVLVLGLAWRHLTVAVAVALDGGVILAVLWLGGFLRNSLIMTSSEHASKRPAAGFPFGRDRRLADKEAGVMLKGELLIGREM